MKIGVHIQAAFSKNVEFIRGALPSHRITDFDSPCEVRLAFCQRLESCPRPPFWAAEIPLLVIVEQHADLQSTLHALKAGVSEVLELNSAPDCFERLEKALARVRSTTEQLHKWIRERGLIAASGAFRQSVRAAVDCARNSSEAILIQGESGTGKEEIARLAHSADPERSRGPLVVVDCTSLSVELAGSELFGHERGAFTGANSRHQGACGAAHGGVLFLDELGELSLPLQAKLLRVVQEKRYRRVGATQEECSDFRLVCATHRDLQRDVEAGRFRADLYYRVSALMLKLPPLRDRQDDVLPLARCFLRQLLRGQPTPDPALHPALVEALRRHPFPGNVRQLRQMMVRAARRYCGLGHVTLAHLDAADFPDQEATHLTPPASIDCFLETPLLQHQLGLDATLELFRNAAYELALHRAEGNTCQAAQLLRRSQRDVQKYLKSRAERHCGQNPAAIES